MKIAVVTGPTASGKTALGVALAERFGGEVVSADSMQVYRRMDIGTAKPAPEEMRGVPHHMLSVAEPEESYSAARYVGEASVCVDDILARGKLPIIVGGTGLYIDSLISGRDFADRDGSEEVRKMLSDKYDAIGGEAFRQKLALFDPERAAKLTPNDRRRLVRAMEVFLVTGRTISEHDEETRRRPPRYDAVKLILDFADRGELYARIDARVDDMVSRGLFAEVESLLGSGVPDSATSMQAIGYKEAVMALRGKMSRAEAVSLIKLGSRRYAKRQLTWLRRDADSARFIWNNPPRFEDALQFSTETLTGCGIK